MATRHGILLSKFNKSSATHWRISVEGSPSDLRRRKTHDDTIAVDLPKSQWDGERLEPTKLRNVEIGSTDVGFIYRFTDR